MQSSVRRLRILFGALLSLFTLGTAACLTPAVTAGYDLRLHYFETGNLPFILSVVFALLGALAAIAFAVTVRTKKLPLSPVYNPATIFCAALIGFLLFFFFIFSIPSASGWMSRISLAVMALSAFYFLIPTQKTAAGIPIRALLSLAPILFAFFSVLEIYFNADMGMNAPLKSYYLMMYLSMALFFTAEARTALLRTKIALYCLFAGLCAVLAGGIGISHIVLSLQGISLPLSQQQSLLSAAIAVYAILRLFFLQETDETDNNTSAE